MGTRRQYSSEFKAKIVLQALTGEKSGSELCCAHKLNPNVLSRWRKEFVEGAASIFESQTPASVNEAQIAELERLVGQLTLQLEIAKKASTYLLGTKNGRS
jgi:transposase